MRIGLIGDVHAEHERLLVTLDVMRAEKVARVLCTGDVVDGHGDPDETCKLLRDHKVTVVRGNHDRWIREDSMRTLDHAHRMTDLAPASIDFLKSLPATTDIDLPNGKKLLLCHGVGENDMQKLNPDDSGYAISSNEALLKVLFDPVFAMMVGGHTHVPFVRRFERGSGQKPLIFVNPGTLSRENEPGFAIVDIAQSRVDFYRIADNFKVSAATRTLI
jgi:predicted phosphodiesterase